MEEVDLGNPRSWNHNRLPAIRQSRVEHCNRDHEVNLAGNVERRYCLIRRCLNVVDLVVATNAVTPRARVREAMVSADANL